MLTARPVRSGLAAAVIVLAATSVHAQPYDHLKCYKIKDTQTFSSVEADIETAEALFGLENCDIKKKAKYFCARASKSVLEVVDGTDSPFPGQDLVYEQVCYKVKCPKVDLGVQLISDQFGSRSADKFKAKLFCTPAVLGLPPTTTTTSTTTTSTTTTLPPNTWSRRAGDAADEQWGVGIALDGIDNVIVTGYFEGQLDFGLGAMTSAGGRDIFVAKFDSNGSILWNQRYGDTGDDNGFDVAVDGSGNIYVVGTFEVGVDFGGGTISSSGLNDIFLAKLDSTGGHLWSNGYGGTGLDYALGLELSSTGEPRIAGFFTSPSIDLGGGAVGIVGSVDGLVAAYDTSGSYQWASTFGSLTNTTYLRDVAIDASGNVALAGYFSGSVDFGGGALVSAGGSDAVVLKLTSGGAHTWSNRYGDSAEQQALGVTIDVTGSVIVTGTNDGGIDLGGGTLTSAGLEDIFLARLTSGGAHDWSSQFGGTGAESTIAVKIRPNGDVVLTGAFESASIDFGGGGIANAGAGDGFVARFTSPGTYAGVDIFADASDQFASRTAMDGSGNMFTTGAFEGTVDFGDGPLVSAGAHDVFVTKRQP